MPRYFFILLAVAIFSLFNNFAAFAGNYKAEDSQFRQKLIEDGFGLFVEKDPAVAYDKYFSDRKGRMLTKDGEPLGILYYRFNDNKDLVVTPSFSSHWWEIYPKGKPPLVIPVRWEKENYIFDKGHEKFPKKIEGEYAILLKKAQERFKNDYKQNFGE